MLYDHINKGFDVKCVGFDYGQTHYKEIDAAKSICEELRVPFELVQLARVFSRSSLLGGSGSVVVPNRNMVFLSVAAAIAEGQNRRIITYGCTREDYDGFPDCRPMFVTVMNQSLSLAGLSARIETPYQILSKRDVVQIGQSLGVPFDKTWSCYIGGQEPCYSCEACKKRTEAFLQAGTRFSI
jgi:7-cyano-7-deazaguanine synthase